MRVVAPVFVGGVKRSNFIVASADVLMDMGVNLQHVVLGIHALLVGEELTASISVKTVYRK